MMLLKLCNHSAPILGVRVRAVYWCGAPELLGPGLRTIPAPSFGPRPGTVRGCYKTLPVFSLLSSEAVSKSARGYPATGPAAFWDRCPVAAGPLPLALRSAKSIATGEFRNRYRYRSSALMPRRRRQEG